MPLVAEWRGKANTTKCYEALQVFDLANLSKGDVFYDLGCGDGWVCIRAARRCKAVKGIEFLGHRVAAAKKNVEKRRLTNVEIIKGDFMEHSIRDATVLYCLIDLKLNEFGIWNRRRKTKTLRIVTLGPPPIPIKPVARKGQFCVTRFPYERAKSRADWYQAVVGRSDASWRDVERKYKKLSGEARRKLKHDFQKYFE